MDVDLVSLLETAIATMDHRVKVLVPDIIKDVGLDIIKRVVADQCIQCRMDMTTAKLKAEQEERGKLGRGRVDVAYQEVLRRRERDRCIRRAGLPWSDIEDDMLAHEVHDALIEMANAHGRSLKAIQCRIQTNGLIDC